MTVLAAHNKCVSDSPAAAAEGSYAKLAYVVLHMPQIADAYRLGCSLVVKTALAPGCKNSHDHHGCHTTSSLAEYSPDTSPKD